MADGLEAWGFAGLGGRLRRNCDWLRGVVGGSLSDKDAALAQKVFGQFQ